MVDFPIRLSRVRPRVVSIALSLSLFLSASEHFDFIIARVVR